jgi:hypothetical protein
VRAECDSRAGATDAAEAEAAARARATVDVLMNGLDARIPAHVERILDTKLRKMAQDGKAAAAAKKQQAQETARLVLAAMRRQEEQIKTLSKQIATLKQAIASRDTRDAEQKRGRVLCR